MSEQPEDSIRRIVLQGGVTLPIIFVAAGLQYWVSVLVAKWLSPADYGDFEVALTFATLLWTIALHGSERSIFQFLPVYVDDEDWGRYHGFVRFHGAVAVALSVVIAVVATVLVVSGTGILIKSGRDVVRYHPLLLAIWLLPILALTNLVDKVPRLFQRMMLSLGPVKILVPLLTLGIVYGLGVHGLELTDWHAVGAFGMASVVVLALQLGVVRTLPAGSSQTVYEPWPWMRSAVPIMTSALLIIAMSQVDILMVEWLGQESAVGVFGIAARSGMFVVMITQAVNAVMAPMITRALASGDRKRRQRTLKIASSLVFWPSFIILGVLGAFGTNILEFIGPDYVDGRYAMLILTTGYLIEGSIGFSKQFILFSTDKRVAVFWLAMAVALDAILNAILIPIAGVTGAAIGTSVAMTSSAVVLSYVTWKRYQILPIPGIRM